MISSYIGQVHQIKDYQSNMVCGVSAFDKYYTCWGPLLNCVEICCDQLSRVVSCIVA